MSNTNNIAILQKDIKNIQVQVDSFVGGLEDNTNSIDEVHETILRFVDKMDKGDFPKLKDLFSFDIDVSSLGTKANEVLQNISKEMKGYLDKSQKFFKTNLSADAITESLSNSLEKTQNFLYLKLFKGQKGFFKDFLSQSIIAGKTNAKVLANTLKISSKFAATEISKQFKRVKNVASKIDYKKIGKVLDDKFKAIKMSIGSIDYKKISSEMGFAIGNLLNKSYIGLKKDFELTSQRMEQRWASVKKGFSSVKSLVSGMFGSLKSKFDAQVEYTKLQVQEKILDLKEKAAKAKELVSGAKDMLKNAKASATKMISSSVKGAKDGFMKLMKPMMKAMMSLAKTVLITLINGVIGLMSGIISILSALVTGSLAILSATVTGLLAVVSAAITAVGAVFTALVGGALVAAGALISAGIVVASAIIGFGMISIGVLVGAGLAMIGVLITVGLWGLGIIVGTSILAVGLIANSILAVGTAGVLIYMALITASILLVAYSALALIGVLAAGFSAILVVGLLAMSSLLLFTPIVVGTILAVGGMITGTIAGGFLLLSVSVLVGFVLLGITLVAAMTLALLFIITMIMGAITKNFIEPVMAILQPVIDFFKMILDYLWAFLKPIVDVIKKIIGGIFGMLSAIGNAVGNAAQWIADKIGLPSWLGGSSDDDIAKSNAKANAENKEFKNIMEDARKNGMSEGDYAQRAAFFADLQRQFAMEVDGGQTSLSGDDTKLIFGKTPFNEIVNKISKKYDGHEVTIENGFWNDTEMDLDIKGAANKGKDALKNPPKTKKPKKTKSNIDAQVSDSVKPVVLPKPKNQFEHITSMKKLKALEDQMVYETTREYKKYASDEITKKGKVPMSEDAYFTQHEDGKKTEAKWKGIGKRVMDRENEVRRDAFKKYGYTAVAMMQEHNINLDEPDVIQQLLKYEEKKDVAKWLKESKNKIPYNKLMGIQTKIDQSKNTVISQNSDIQAAKVSNAIADTVPVAQSDTSSTAANAEMINQLKQLNAKPVQPNVIIEPKSQKPNVLHRR